MLYLLIQGNHNKKNSLIKINSFIYYILKYFMFGYDIYCIFIIKWINKIITQQKLILFY